MAYLVGLIVTDGNLSKDGRHIIFRSSDYPLLETVVKCLGITRPNPIKKTKPALNSWTKKTSYRIQYGNVKLYRWLLNLGLFPAKTYTLGEIKVPDQFFMDFLRGHLDGDGTVRTYMDGYNIYRGRQYTNYRLMTSFISASQDHIFWLRSKIISLTGCYGSIFINKKNSKRVGAPIWVLKFSKKEWIKLLKYIYYKPSLPCLERKMTKATEGITQALNVTRKIYSRIWNAA